jgi:hypothetical protein
MFRARLRQASPVALLVTVLLGLPVCLASESSQSKPKNLPPAPVVSVVQANNRIRGLPLMFEPNLGQSDGRVHFLTRAPGMISFLTDSENVIVLSRSKKQPDSAEPNRSPEMERSVVRMVLEGARRPGSFEGFEKAESISNYFIGKDSAKWLSNVPNYRRVRATEVYPGIDVVYYGYGRRLEYDFVVGPGADPRRIHLAYEGAENVTMDKAGNLLIATRLGTLVQRKPKVYQELGGERREVEAAYMVRGGRVEIALGDWDRRRELVIDPVLDYSTYLGGSGNDYGTQVVVDSAGAAYVVGYTASANFPTLGALQPGFGGGTYDVFVTKLNPAGSALVYSTYLGGSASDVGNAIAVDSNGEAFITGTTVATTGSNFPVTSGAFQTSFLGDPGFTHGFVAKLNAAGNGLVYSTYLGGAGTANAADSPGGIKIDASGNAYVSGYTGSLDFPTTQGAFQTAYQGGLRDIFVTKLNTTGSELVYSTFVGSPNADYANNIAIDSSGGAYVTGYSNACTFPTPNGFQHDCGGKGQNLIVAKLNPAGSALDYATYIGYATSTGRNIAVNGAGEAYVTGFVQNDETPPSPTFPTTPGALQPSYGGGGRDAYVVKLSADGSRLEYATYLGGADADQGQGITVDSIGGAYISGYTSSSNFHTSGCAHQTTNGGSQDAFVTRLDPSGNLEYSTYLGGAGTESGDGIGVDGNGKVYVTGNTNSANFPTTTGAFEESNQGTVDAFVSKLTPISDFPGSAKAVNAVSGTPQSTSIGDAFSTHLQAQVVDTFGNPVSGVTVTFNAPGSGASATISPNTSITDCTGNTGQVTATANNTTGTYQVLADVAGTGASVGTFQLTNTAGAPHSMAIYGESTQSAQVNTVFADPLTVLVTDSFGNPVAGVPVTFAALGTTANASLSSSTVTTGANGQAAVIATANGTPGNYTVSATSSVGFVNFSLVNITGGSTSVTTTTLAASPTAAMFGDPVLLHATVSPAGATGLVFFRQGSTVLGSATLSGGAATLSVSTLPVGTYMVVADYEGDSNYAGSQSGPAAITITKKTGAGGGAALMVTANNATRSFGQPNPAFSSTTTGTLVAGDTFASAISGVPVFSTPATTASPAGTYPITISGLTSANYVLALVSGTLTVTKLSGSVHLDASPNPAMQGDQVTLTATVGGGETGTVTFYDGTTVLGTATISGGVATLVISALGPGTHSITAVYNGDANFTAATSAPVSLTINAAPDFGVTSPTPPQIVPPGAAAEFAVNIPSLHAPFNSPVTLTATGLPAGATYTFSPNPVTPGASGINSELTVNVPMQSARLDRGYRTPLVLAVMLVPLALLRRTRCRPPRLLLWLLVAMASFTAMTGCGSGGYFSQPQRTYIITVTGTSGGLVRSTTVTLTVE